MADLGFYIFETVTSTFELWTLVASHVNGISLEKNNTEVFMAQIAPIVEEINNESKSVLDTIYAELTHTLKGRKKIGSDPKKVSNIIKIAKLAYQLQSIRELPFFTEDDIINLKHCAREEALIYIDIMDKCGVNDQCNYFLLMDAIVAFAKNIEVSQTDENGKTVYVPILSVDPCEYEHMMIERDNK